MTILASIKVAAEDFELGQALAATTTRIELTQFVPIDNQLVPYFWKEDGGDSESFEQNVREHSAVGALDHLDGRVNASLYRIDWTEHVDGFIEALSNTDILVEEATTTNGESWLFKLRATDQEALSMFQRDCHDAGVPLDIRRVYHNPDGEHQPQTLIGVTSKQREALVLALERGYFQVPRDVTAGELGDELEISRQAFSRRLARAQQSLVSNILSDLTNQ